MGYSGQRLFIDGVSRMLAEKHNHQRTRAGRRRDGGEELNTFLFSFFLFLILARLMKGIFGFHIC